MDSGPLVAVAELADSLHRAGPGLVLADVRWTLGGPPGRPAYEAGHLPGAQWVDLEADLSAPAGVGGRHPPPPPVVFAAAMSRIGVSDPTTVVVYDEARSLAAARLWWLLTDAGHPHVRVLEGGFRAWVEAGHPVETGPGHPVAPGSFTDRPGQLPQHSGPELAEQIRTGRAPTLVDVRAAERYAGSHEPIDSVAGHLPGALSRPATDLVDAAGRFDPAAVAEHFGDLDAPVLYCGSGITAAQALLALRAAGRADASLYPGSWSDWITDRQRPVASGPTP